MAQIAAMQRRAPMTTSPKLRPATEVAKVTTAA
jgi:hypothetical protein